MSKFNWSNPPYKIKKDGTQSKLHDRSVFRTPGNEVELAYGTFTVLKAEKVNKIWYVTLKDVNETFKIKQQQMGNKKLPKTRVIINDMQPVIAGLLPAPIDPLDYYVAQCIIIKNNFNNNLLNDPNNYTRKNTLKRAIQRRLINDEPPHLNLIGQYRFGGLLYTVEDYCRYQVYFICNVYNAIHDQNTLKRIKHELIRSYHPDTNTYFANPIKLHIVKNIYIDNEEEWVC